MRIQRIRIRFRIPIPNTGERGILCGVSHLNDLLIFSSFSGCGPTTYLLISQIMISDSDHLDPANLLPLFTLQPKFEDVSITDHRVGRVLSVSPVVGIWTPPPL